ncbi:delta tubulin, partial [Kipferlia bialata]
VLSAHPSSLMEYDSKASVVRQSGSANNWAYGFCHHGPSVIADVLDRVQRQVEACDSLGGMVSLSSLAGGTGSGLGAYCCAALSDQYPSAPLLAQTVLPHPSEVMTQDHNAVLSLAALSQHVTGVVLSSNPHAAHLFRSSASSAADRIARPSLNDLNQVLAHTLSLSLLPLRPNRPDPVGRLARVYAPPYPYATPLAIPYYSGRDRDTHGQGGLGGGMATATWYHVTRKVGESLANYPYMTVPPRPGAPTERERERDPSKSMTSSRVAVPRSTRVKAASQTVPKEVLVPQTCYAADVALRGGDCAEVLHCMEQRLETEYAMWEEEEEEGEGEFGADLDTFPASRAPPRTPAHGGRGHPSTPYATPRPATACTPYLRGKDSARIGAEGRTGRGRGGVSDSSIVKSAAVRRHRAQAGGILSECVLSHPLFPLACDSGGLVVGGADNSVRAGGGQERERVRCAGMLVNGSGVVQELSPLCDRVEAKVNSTAYLHHYEDAGVTFNDFKDAIAVVRQTTANYNALAAQAEL